MRSTLNLIVAPVLLTLIPVTPTWGRCLTGQCSVVQRPAHRLSWRSHPFQVYAAPIYSTPVYYVPAVPVVVVPPTAPVQPIALPSPGTPQPPADDPYGFVAWLNGLRASRGLNPVVSDTTLRLWASANNQQQQLSGLGHWVHFGQFRQNVGWGSLGQVGRMWLDSPAHAALLFDPAITRVGIDVNGDYITLDGY